MAYAKLTLDSLPSLSNIRVLIVDSGLDPVNNIVCSWLCEHTRQVDNSYAFGGKDAKEPGRAFRAV